MHKLGDCSVWNECCVIDPYLYVWKNSRFLRSSQIVLWSHSEVHHSQYTSYTSAPCHLDKLNMITHITVSWHSHQHAIIHIDYEAFCALPSPARLVGRTYVAAGHVARHPEDTPAHQVLRCGATLTYHLVATQVRVGGDVQVALGTGTTLQGQR